MVPFLEDAADAESTLVLEVVTVCSLIVGLLVWRHCTSPEPPPLRESCRPDSCVVDDDLPAWAKTLHADLGAGHGALALKRWRAQEGGSRSSVELVRLAVEVFLEACPSTLAAEVVDHVARHPELLKRAALVTAIDAIAKVGRVELLESLLDCFRTRLRVRPTREIHEAVVACYASVGDETRLAAHMAQMADGEQLSARAHLGILWGFLRKRPPLADAALGAARAMATQSLVVPAPALSELARYFCEAGRAAEVLTWGRGLQLPAEAVLVFFEHCQKAGDLELAIRLHDARRSERLTMCPRSYDNLLRLQAANGCPHTLTTFGEMQAAGHTVGEGLCIALISKSAECKTLVTFAEAVAAHLRQRHKTSIALYSALMKVYAHAGFRDKACDLYAHILADGFEPDRTMYGALLRLAASCNRAPLVWQLLSKAPSLDSTTSTAVLRAAGQGKDVRMACGLLERMKALSQVPDTSVYNCALDVFALAGDIRRARAVLEEMRLSKAGVDVITYNTVLKGFAQCDDMQGAKQLLKEMEAGGVAPNDISYNVIVNMSVSSGNLSEAFVQVEAMTSRGISVDSYTISTFMKAAKKSKCQRDVFAVFDLLDRSGLDVTSDEVLLNTVLEVCVRHREKRRLQAILDRLSLSKLEPAVHTYGILLRACNVLRKSDRCRELWREMVDARGLQPSEVVLGCMLDALVNDDAVEEAVALLGRWKSVIKPNPVMYSTLLKGFAKACDVGRALALLEDMRADGIPMTTCLYNSLIDVQARIGDTDAISRLCGMMERDGCKPDGFTMSLSVKAYCASGKLALAFEAFQSMCQGCPGNTLTVGFNTLLDGCIRHNEEKMADDLLGRMDVLGIAANNFTLGTLAKLWGRRRDLDRAFADTAALARKHGLRPDGPTFMSLISACLMNDDLDRALGALAELRASGFSPGARGYTALISGAARLGALGAGVRLAEEAYGLADGAHACQEDMEPHALLRLATELAAAGRMETLGRPLFERLRARGVPLSGGLARLPGVAGDVATSSSRPRRRRPTPVTAVAAATAMAAAAQPRRPM